MTGEKVLRAIEAVAAEHLGRRGLSPEMKLVEDLELDSIELLTFAVEVENRFRIVIDPESESLILTVGDLVRVVRRKLEDAENPE